MDDRKVTIDGGNATVVQTLEVTVPGSDPATVERTEDGDWVPTELSECPFQQ